MCVLAFAWRAHPDWLLVLAGNRDERHDRASAPLAHWPGAGAVMGGRDLVAGGSWLGASGEGRFAVVTNVRGYGAPVPEAPSRGRLVEDVLQGEGRFADPGDVELSDFNPMNLITVRGGEAEFWTNRPVARRQTLSPGVYGMSNGGLDDGWPKTDRLKGFLAEWLEGGSGRAAPLLEALSDEQRPPDALLPATGIGLERERLVSSIFIREALYGTRCSSVVMISADGTGVFTERRFDETGRASGETVLSFTWPPEALCRQTDRGANESI